MKPSDLAPAAGKPYEPAGRLDPAGFDTHVDFRTYPPPEAMRPFLGYLWVIRWSRLGQAPYFSEQLMPRPYVDAFVSQAESGIQHTFRGSRTYVAAGEGRIIGARFLPGAFHAFWNRSLAGWTNKTMGLSQVFPAGNVAFLERILAGNDDHAVQQLAALIQSGNPVWDFNIELVNQIIDAVEQNAVDCAALAYDLGYSSQQHFIADFRRVLGKTPVQYKNELIVSKMEL